MDHGPWILRYHSQGLLTNLPPTAAESWRLRQILTRRASICVSFYEALPMAMIVMIHPGTEEACVSCKVRRALTSSPMTLLITDSVITISG